MTDTERIDELVAIVAAMLNEMAHHHLHIYKAEPLMERLIAIKAAI